MIASETHAQKSAISSKEDETAHLRRQLDKTESAVRNVRYKSANIGSFIESSVTFTVFTLIFRLSNL